jgi:hypothetical protein
VNLLGLILLLGLASMHFVALLVAVHASRGVGDGVGDGVGEGVGDGAAKSADGSPE